MQPPCTLSCHIPLHSETQTQLCHCGHGPFVTSLSFSFLFSKMGIQHLLHGVVGRQDGVCELPNVVTDVRLNLFCFLNPPAFRLNFIRHFRILTLGH